MIFNKKVLGLHVKNIYLHFYKCMFRCQEIEDPLYDTRAPPTQSSGQARIQASASKGNSTYNFKSLSNMYTAIITKYINKYIPNSHKTLQTLPCCY